MRPWQQQQQGSEGTSERAGCDVISPPAGCAHLSEAHEERPRAAVVVAVGAAGVDRGGRHAEVTQGHRRRVGLQQQQWGGRSSKQRRAGAEAGRPSPRGRRTGWRAPSGSPQRVLLRPRAPRRPACTRVQLQGPGLRASRRRRGRTRRGRGRRAWRLQQPGRPRQRPPKGGGRGGGGGGEGGGRGALVGASARWSVWPTHLDAGEPDACSQASRGRQEQPEADRGVGA